MIFIYFNYCASKPWKKQSQRNPGWRHYHGSNVGNCSTTHTASRPLETHSFFYCMALFVFLIMIFWLSVCSPLGKFRLLDL